MDYVFEISLAKANKDSEILSGKTSRLSHIKVNVLRITVWTKW